MDAFKFKVIIRHSGYWKTSKGSGHMKYYFGHKLFVECDSDYANYRDFVEDISQLVHCNSNYTFDLAWLLPNPMPKQYNFVVDDKSLMDMFSENRLTDGIIRLFVSLQSSRTPYGIEKSTNHSLSIQDISLNLLKLVDDFSPPSEHIIDVNNGEIHLDSDYCTSESSYHSLASSSSKSECSIVGLEAKSDKDEHEEYDSSAEIHSNNVEILDDDIVEDSRNEIMDSIEKTELVVGALFPSVHAFRQALRQHCIKHYFKVDFVKNESYRVTARCGTSESCPWRIHASRLQDKVTFCIKTMLNEHKCYAVTKSDNKMENSEWISTKVAEEVKKNPDISISLLRSFINTQYGLNLPYERVWLGIEKAQEMIFGNIEASYKSIPDLQTELLARNPGSIVRYELDDDSCFLRFFVFFKACSQGFLHGCRRFIGVDSCHLRGKYKGVLLAATALDGNNQLYPIAFAIAEIECGNSWAWFLHCLKDAIGDLHDLTFMSDRMQGIDSVMSVIFLKVEHWLCVRHLYKNFKSKWQGSEMEHLVWNAARAFVEPMYDHYLKEIEARDVSAYSYLKEIKTHKWSRCTFGNGAKCDYLTNNLSESFNKMIREIRTRPVSELIDALRRQLMVRMDERRIKALKWKERLTPRAHQYVRNIAKETHEGSMYRSSDVECEMENCYGRYTVNLVQKTCDCRAWQVTGLPCIHAATAIIQLRYNLEDFVDDMYNTQKLRVAYSLPINPIPEKSLWRKSDHGVIIHAPKQKRPAGRPKKQRIKGRDELLRVEKTTRCGRCGKLGHNKRSCKERIGNLNNVGAQGNQRNIQRGVKSGGRNGARSLNRVAGNLGGKDGSSCGMGKDGTTLVSSKRGRTDDGCDSSYPSKNVRSRDEDIGFIDLLLSQTSTNTFERNPLLYGEDISSFGNWTVAPSLLVKLPSKEGLPP